MLRLSKMADYAVVILACLNSDHGHCQSGAHIAQRAHLPEPTVAKLTKTLARHGIIDSVRGASGGYVLRQGADRISLASIIRAVEGPIALSDCVEESPKCCSIAQDCPAHGVWQPVNKALVQLLEEMTLDDLLSGFGRKNTYLVSADPGTSAKLPAKQESI